MLSLFALETDKRFGILARGGLVCSEHNANLAASHDTDWIQDRVVDRNVLFASPFLLHTQITLSHIYVD